jgi:hypothetical protein
MLRDFEWYSVIFSGGQETTGNWNQTTSDNQNASFTVNEPSGSNRSINQMERISGESYSTNGRTSSFIPSSTLSQELQQQAEADVSRPNTWLSISDDTQHLVLVSFFFVNVVRSLKLISEFKPFRITECV